MAARALNTSVSLPELRASRMSTRGRSSSFDTRLPPKENRPTANADSDKPARAEVHGKPVHNLHLTLWDIFSTTARTHPEREAIVSLWQPAGSDGSSQQLSPTRTSGCLRWTYHDLLNRVDSLAELLEGLGCGPGMQLAALLWNSAEWGLFFWVTAKIGMTFVPIDPRIPDDARRMLSSLKAQVVVAQDAEVAAIVSTVDGRSGIRIQCSAAALAGWASLEQVSRFHGHNDSAANCGGLGVGSLQETEGDGRNFALVVFTSGTTGVPKGCPHTDRNLISQTCDYDPNTDRSIIDRWLVHTPVSHIFAANNALRAWRCGDVVVFASKTFDVEATLGALKQERCTIMSATPTLVKGLLAHQSLPDSRELKLELVSIGGTSVTAEDVALCRRGLGAKAATQAFGMSEGAPLISWSRTDAQLVDGYHKGVGKVLPGAAVRICRPRSRCVLSHGETGEMHVSGSSVISNYLGTTEGDSFYDDGNLRWFKTGDQARMDQDGVVHILGRYKDIIIRGGENIYPVRVESALAGIPGLQAHVVGIPDKVAGQVPVAIVQLPPALSRDEAVGKIRQLDLRYTLDEIYTLDDLGFDSVPLTSIGKVKKEMLKNAVMQRREWGGPVEAPPSRRLQLPADTTTRASTAEALAIIWERLTGSQPPKDGSVVHFADSIMLLRYCESVLRSCGQRLYLQDLAENNTLEKQAKLLDTRGSRDSQPAQQLAMANGHRYTADMPQDSSFRGDAEKRFSQLPKPTGDGDLRRIAKRKMETLGLEGCRVETVCMIRASLHRTVVGQREHSYHVRMVFRAGNAGPKRIRRGLEQALQSRPMMRSILCRRPSEEPYHAIVEADQRLFDRLIQEVNVENEDKASVLFQSESPDSHRSPFMLKAEMVTVDDSNQMYLCMTYNHSIVDALTLLQWHFDLDRVISNPTSRLTVRTPYTMFADLFDQYRDSFPAQKSVLFHVRRLRGVSRFSQALWPRQRAPGWMISNDESSSHAQERGRLRRNLWGGEWETRMSEFRYPRIGRVVWLPRLNRLQQEHGIHPAILARCALVIFNVLQTGSSHALFSTWESGRSWPFIPQWMEPMLPPPMSIDGPTAQWILGLFEVIKGETVIEFLGRHVAEHEQAICHEHAPWDKIVEELRDEGEVAMDASFRQSFVWDVSIGLTASQGFRSDMESLEPIARYDWADCGLFWNAFMVNRDNLCFVASWDTAQMNAAEVEGHCDQLAEVMRKLADARRWGETISAVFGV